MNKVTSSLPLPLFSGYLCSCCHYTNSPCTVLHSNTRTWLSLQAEKPEFKNLRSFLFGQSMGGAVALKMHLKQPEAWNGAVLLAPMCKVCAYLMKEFVNTPVANYRIDFLGGLCRLQMTCTHHSY